MRVGTWYKGIFGELVLRLGRTESVMGWVASLDFWRLAWPVINLGSPPGLKSCNVVGRNRWAIEGRVGRNGNSGGSLQAGCLLTIPIVAWPLVQQKASAGVGS